jgi:hypothetical protein
MNSQVHALTALERAIYEAIRNAHPEVALPMADHVVVKSRTNTGAGRYVELWGIPANRRILDMGGKYIEMQGVPNGLMAVLCVDTAKSEIEIATYGIHDWDGREIAWRIV